MSEGKTFRIVLFSALVTAIIFWLLQAMDINRWLCSIWSCNLGGWTALYASILTLHFIAAIPAFFCMHYYKVQHSFFINIVAVYETFWLGILFSFFFNHPSVIWINGFIKSCLLIGLYAIFYFYFIQWKVALVVKLSLALVIMIVTTLVSDRVALLLL